MKKTTHSIHPLLLILAFSCSQIQPRQSPSLPSEKESPQMLKAVSKKPLWRGLVVAKEKGCAPYNRDRDYNYRKRDPNLEDKIIKMNLEDRLYSPYTGETFKSVKESTIEHIVATKEAHRSGLCVADRNIRSDFSVDLRNLTLASGKLNSQKRDKDAAKWIPELNRCWFAETVIAVKKKYGLTVDEKEKTALKEVFDGCKCDDKSEREKQGFGDKPC